MFMKMIGPALLITETKLRIFHLPGDFPPNQVLRPAMLLAFFHYSIPFAVNPFLFTETQLMVIKCFFEFQRLLL